jgi:hypothetical protein
MIRISARASAQSLTSASVTLLSVSTALPAQSTPTQPCMQTNLVADTFGAAEGTDTPLVIAWGMSRGTTTPWISDNRTGLATLYMRDVRPSNQFVFHRCSGWRTARVTL